MRAALSFNASTTTPPPPQIHCAHYMGRELREGLGSLINEHDDTGYKSHWYSIAHTMATKRRKKRTTEDEGKTSVWVQYGGQDVA